MTNAMWMVLRRASTRPGGYICPTYLRGGAENSMVKKLQRERFASDEMAPVITPEGRAAASAHQEP